MPVGLEGVGAIDTAHAPLARSTVAHAEEHAIFNSIPEESDLDPIALAEPSSYSESAVCGNTSTA